MTKIYTKAGDKGQTGLWGGDRLSKSHPRVRAYGEIDELNSAVGLVLANWPDAKTFNSAREALEAIQEELFVVGALLATPSADIAGLPAPFNSGVPAGAVSTLEKKIDQMTAELKPLSNFILPGGSIPGALLHSARTVCRRAEREIVALVETEAIPDHIIVYVNRLSDFLFTAARWVNAKLKRPETQWKGLSGK